MATTRPPSNTTLEACPSCETPQPHEVSIQLVTESDTDQNREFSREPYRVAECRSCGRTTRIRMNNA